MNAVTIAWRRALMRVLVGALRPRPPGGLPDWGARPHQVLFIRHQRIGDLLMATGTIRAIAKSHPTLRVDVLVSPGSATVLDGNPYVRRVLSFERRRWWTWPRVMLTIRRTRYDVLIDGQVNHSRVFPTEVALMAAAAVPLRVGADLGPGDRIYTVPVTVAPTAHFVEQTAATAIPFGVDPAAIDLRPDLQVTKADWGRADAVWAAVAPDVSAHAPRVLVNVSVAEAWRRWPEERFIATVRHLLERSPRPIVMVIGAPSDSGAVQRIAASTGTSWRVPGLRDAMAIVATADLVFTPNTSLSHVASAVGVPVVEMLPRSHAAFTAYQTVGKSLIARDDNVTSISVEDVVQALDTVLQRLPNHHDRDRARVEERRAS